MTLGTPYTAVAGNTTTAGATYQVTCTHNVAVGDTVVVAASSNSLTAAPTGVTDSQGNTYTQALLDATRSPNVGIYVGAIQTALVSGTDWFKGTFAASTLSKSLIARGCSGVLATSAVDVGITADASSGTGPSSGSSGTLKQPHEWAVAVLANGTAGGAPSAWTGGFTAVVTEGTGPFLTLADQVVAATTALDAGATIVSSVWEMALVTLKAIDTVTVTSPGNQVTTQGIAVDLAITGSSANNLTLTWSATGLPAGLSIGASTGVITGTPTTAGTSNVTVTAESSTGATGPVSFTWAIKPAGGWMGLPVPDILKLIGAGL